MTTRISRKRSVSDVHNPLLVGERVPPSWRGEVRDFFGHAVNVLVRPVSEGMAPLIVTVLDSPRNMGERCVVVEPELFELLRQAWEASPHAGDGSRHTEDTPRHTPQRVGSAPKNSRKKASPDSGDTGDAADAGGASQSAGDAPFCLSCKDGVLDCGPGLPRLDLGRAERWHTPSLVVRGPASGRLLRQIARALGPATHPEPWGDEVYRRFDAWATGMGPLSAVVGAGPGLTPAGDDMLIGFLCGLNASRAYSAEALRRLHELRETLPPLLDATSEVSRAFVEDALDGRFHQALAGLCLALHPGAAPRRAGNGRRHSMNEALSFGAGSGREGAYGLLSALWLVRPWRDAR